MMPFAHFHRRLWFALLIILPGLALLQACAPPEMPREIPVLPSGIRRIALLPVLFADRAQDRYVEYRTGEEIIRQARRTLDNKGYLVILADSPSRHNFIRPFTPTANNPAALAALAPSEVDAVMVIRIDHFLDAALYGVGDNNSGSGGGNESLDLYATAELISRQGNQILWRRQGVGGSTGFGGSGLHEIRASHDLIDTLFAIFPESTQ